MSCKHLETHKLLYILFRLAGLVDPVEELRFHPTRRWRFDYAWPESRIALEVEGGVWNRGRHIRPKGYEKDCEKYNAAALDGWRVFRVTTGMIHDGRALCLLQNIVRCKLFLTLPQPTQANSAANQLQGEGNQKERQE